MQRTIYLNGKFVDAKTAKISVFDRGFLFADSVYEGFGVLQGRFLDFDRHYARLCRSLSETGIPQPLDQNDIYRILLELITRNEIDNGFMYMQITRGTQDDRDFLYPEGMTPNVMAFGQQSEANWVADNMPRPIAMRSAADLRWARCDIKTNNLLAQVMVKQIARTAGADEALMIDSEGYITEGGSTSFFIIRDGVLYVRPLAIDILHGVTRKTMLSVAEQCGLTISEKKYRLEDVFAADEAFHTAASMYIKPVGSVDGQSIGKGEAGPFTIKLRQAYLSKMRSESNQPDN